jgi:hypothetical protein
MFCCAVWCKLSDATDRYLACTVYDSFEVTAVTPVLGRGKRATGFEGLLNDGLNHSMFVETKGTISYPHDLP